MKFQLTKEDENRINKIDETSPSSEPALHPDGTGHKYYLEFSCVDIAKANNFIMALMHPTEEELSDVKNILGINAHAIHYAHSDHIINDPIKQGSPMVPNENQMMIMTE